MACALDVLVEKNRLTALAYYYKGEDNNLYERMGAALIIANTLLTSAGIPPAGEANLKTAATMLIINRIGEGKNRQGSGCEVSVLALFSAFLGEKFLWFTFAKIARK